MRSIPNWQLIVPLALAVASLPAQTMAQQDSGAIALAEKQITGMLTELADVHCTETVIQEKLSESGHVEASAREQFDYLIMISGHEDDFQLSESRIENPGWRHKLLSTPMLMTNGMATVLLVFHPYYRDGFNFTTLPAEAIDGKPAIPIHFVHIPGRRTPAALALRGREYPLDLQGTAWLDEASGKIVKVDASLVHDMSDVGLRSLNIHVEYKTTRLGSNPAQIVLPALAVVDVASLHQHWRNTHYFGNFRSFSANVEQDPNVKIHSDDPQPGNTTTPGSPPADPKEKP
jgi:Na+-transporting methylmalonyl-CoA/oxaloacetate decarboxylase gamma subunit